MYRLNFKNIKAYKNYKKGLGPAITLGISKSEKNYLAIMMSDMSDDVEDLKKYYNLINKNELDAVFGSRFLKNSKIENYPKLKLILNRFFNLIVKIIFRSEYNDFTNAFKIYRLKTLKDLMPLVSENFNIFLEIPLKLILRDYSYSIISISWKGRNKGNSKFKIKELGSKYLKVLIYCLLNKIGLIK